MDRVKLLTNILTAIVLVGSLLAVLLPAPPNAAELSYNFQVYMFVSFGVVLSFVSAGILFILGFRGFTDQLKRAYGVICLGLFSFGVGQIQIPILILSDQVNSFYAKTGIYALPLLVALASLFWGMRMFARLVGAKGIFTSSWFVFVASIAAAVGSIFLPHMGQASPEAVFDANLAFITLATAIVMGCAVVALQIKRATNVTYANAMAWMFVAFAGISAVGVHYIFALLVLGDLHPYTLSGILFGSYMFAGLLFMRAAYAFNTIPLQEAVSYDVPRNFFGRPRVAETAHEVSSLDIVMYTAELASNPQAIDGIMDRVRGMTAMQTPGTQLSPESIGVLKNVYLALERYLIHKEPVRKFTQESLRYDIQTKLHLAANSQPTFWSQL